jgi:hypothetical protein
MYTCPSHPAPAERALLRTVSDLAYANPFLPQRVTLERAVLGAEFVEGEPVWSMRVDQPDQPRANVWKIIALLEPLVERLRERWRRRAFCPRRIWRCTQARRCT